MRKYSVQLAAVSDYGEQADLGTVEVEARNQNEARQQAMDMLWDSRLDAASCTPLFRIALLKKAPAPPKISRY